MIYRANPEKRADGSVSVLYCDELSTVPHLFVMGSEELLTQSWDQILLDYLVKKDAAEGVVDSDRQIVKLRDLQP